MLCREGPGVSADWYLVGDIGGTNARFALEDPAHPELRCVRSYSVAEHSAFIDALQTYLAEAREQGCSGLPEAACLIPPCDELR